MKKSIIVLLIAILATGFAFAGTLKGSASLEFNVDLPEEDDDIFQRVVKIMKQGCLVTGSLHDGIEMSYDLKPSYAAEKE